MAGGNAAIGRLLLHEAPTGGAGLPDEARHRLESGTGVQGVLGRTVRVRTIGPIPVQGAAPGGLTGLEYQFDLQVSVENDSPRSPRSHPPARSAC